MKQLDREALILDRAIDLLVSGERAAEHPLVDEAEQFLRAVESLPPSLSRDQARERMFAEPIGRPRRRRARWLVAVPAAAVLGLGSVAFAARNATPGDALYGIRRSEQASHIALTFGARANAEARLDRAAEDLADGKALFAAGRTHDAREALAHFWDDLADARRAIRALPAGEQTLLEARANALESDGMNLEGMMTAFGGTSGPGTIPEDRGGPGKSGGQSEPGDGRGGPSGSGDHTSGDVETHPTPSSDTGGSASGSGSESSPTPTAEPTSTPTAEPTSGAGGGSDDHPQSSQTPTPTSTETPG